MKIATQGLSRYSENMKLWSGQTEKEAESVAARVKTRSFGFRIGKLGVNFTAKDLEFEPGDAAKASQDFRSKAYPRTQSEERHVQNVSQQLALTQAALSEDSATFNPGSSGYMRARAVNAYSQQAASLDYALPGSTLGKV
ncbi:hypothetical protein [Maridesulfovibrio sp.]|uniref:hypothetical protein n=1 Tax=Maridesulfovibrio sp. TaxID=2795000 RepID=UPI002A1878D3|nr:hypothetical protein [Maridesulfovibrio sp.]